LCVFFFFKQKTAYEIRLSLVGSEMCIRDRSIAQLIPIEAKSTHCPLKGDASYFSVDGSGAPIAWSYEVAFDLAKVINGRVAFYPDKVTVEEVGAAVCAKSSNNRASTCSRFLSKPDGSELDEGREVGCMFLISRSDAPTVLHPVEEPFNVISMTVEIRTEADRIAPVSTR